MSVNVQGYWDYLSKPWGKEILYKSHFAHST